MNENGNIVVQTVGLTKVFKDFWMRPRVTAVRDLDLDIRRGEVFGLLGPNGSGKSTTIKMLLGLLYPTRGRISVLDHPPTDVSIKSRIGYLPEESYLYAFLNARETLEYYGRLFQLSRRDRESRIDMLLEMVGLEHEQRRRVGEYSKGMARRIGLAQALINDPEFLILDEPTAGLDPIGTKLIKDLIVDLARRGKTILLSSHLLADVEDVCDRVSILYGGQERQSGDIKQLLAREELTQITAPRLSARTVERIKALIREAEGKEVLGVSAPTEKLEDLFLRLVREAHAADTATSGARVGGELPEFLAADAKDTRRVIDDLVDAADEKPEAPPEAEPAPVAPEADTGKLESLVAETAGPQEKGGEPLAAPQRTPTPEPAGPVDRGLLDALVETDDTQDGHNG